MANTDVTILNGYYKNRDRGDVSLEKRLGDATRNTGNLMFLEALERQLAHSHVVSRWEALSTGSGNIVLSMANFINPFTDVSIAAELLRKSAAERIVMVGCGAQADAYDDIFDIKEDTKAFLEFISERSHSIGIRGEFTRGLLEKNGISNVDIIGCPSLFYFGSQAPKLRSAKQVKKLVVGVTPNGRYNESIRQLFSVAMRHDSSYLLQSEEFLLPLFSPGELHGIEEKSFVYFTKMFCPAEASRAQFIDWLSDNCVLNFGIEANRQFFSEADFYLGSRIHGAIAAILSGCPALLLTSDTRTRELAEYLDIPHIDFADFSADKDIEYYYGLSDYKDFTARYAAKYERYKQFLEANGLEIREGDNVPMNRNGIVLSSQKSEQEPALEKTTGQGPTPDPAKQIAETKASALKALNEVGQHLRKYSRLTGSAPQFILGEKSAMASISTAKLEGCKVYGNREEIINDMVDAGEVVEVGTQMGNFAAYILENKKNIILHTIDMNYSLFQWQKLQPHIDSGRLKTIESLSWDGLAAFEDEHFSWIYIDASHFYDHVQKDLEIAKSKVKVGGYLLCNDYTVWSPFEASPYGVLQAVNEFLATESFRVTHISLHPNGYHDIAMQRLS
jgi:predicted O-methyltransferase YrrM